jgi:hypothetical protein
MDPAWSGHANDFKVSFPGTTVTSMYRDPKKNAQVGGVANSYHTKGQAFDAVVPASQKAAAMAWAKQRGMEAIDEGDHIHFEPARQAQNPRPAAAPKPQPKAGGKGSFRDVMGG